MNAGIVSLVLAYVLSQFYRAFLAVMAPELEISIGAGPADLASASGMWFLVFALMQIPIGEMLDRIGPRLTSSIMFAIGGAGGAAVFALATAPWHVSLAMGMIGFGCAPVLMASYYIFAQASMARRCQCSQGSQSPASHPPMWQTSQGHRPARKCNKMPSKQAHT